MFSAKSEELCEQSANNKRNKQINKRNKQTGFQQMTSQQVKWQIK